MREGTDGHRRRGNEMHNTIMRTHREKDNIIHGVRIETQHGRIGIQRARRGRPTSIVVRAENASPTIVPVHRVRAAVGTRRVFFPF